MSTEPGLEAVPMTPAERVAKAREERMPELRMRFWLAVMEALFCARLFGGRAYCYAVEKAGDAAHARRLP